MGHFKFFMASLIMVLFALPIMAQDASATEVTIDVGTFTGLMALVPLIVTQVSKVIPAISNSKWLKILISAVVGILVCMVLWLLKVETPMLGMEWWQALVYGLAVGLSGSGLYDLIKVIGSLFSKKDE